MPRSVIALSNEPDFFNRVRQAFDSDLRFIVTGDVVHCDGTAAPLTNIYEIEMTEAEWEGWDAIVGDLPDPRGMSHLIFECRSPEWIAEVGRLLVEKTVWPVWFLDSADVAWHADQVDPDRVSLS